MLCDEPELEGEDILGEFCSDDRAGADRSADLLEFEAALSDLSDLSDEFLSPPRFIKPTPAEAAGPGLNATARKAVRRTARNRNLVFLRNGVLFIALPPLKWSAR
jgi:hypothetical protein